MVGAEGLGTEPPRFAVRVEGLGAEAPGIGAVRVEGLSAEAPGFGVGGAGAGNEQSVDCLGCGKGLA